MSDPSPATPTPSLATGAIPGVVPPSSTAQGSRQIPPPAQVPPPYSPDLKHLLTIVVAVVVISALYLAREVLIPITLAILLSFVVAPVVGLLRRLGLWRTPAVLAAVLLAMGVILVLGSIIGLQIAGLAQDLPRYQATIQRKVDTVQGTALGWVNDFVRQIDHAQPATPPPATPGEDFRPMRVEIQQGQPSPVELAQRLLSPVLGPLETVFIVVIVAIFILMQQADLRDRLIRLFGSDDLHRTTVALDDAAKRLSKYFLAQLAINGCFGAVVAAGLFFIGVPSPLLWGILAALFRFIPYVGALLAAALPIALAAGVDPGWNMVIWTAALFLVTEPIMGQVVEPMVYGHSTGLSPVSVIVAAIFWTWLWGPIGLILATPLTLCLVVLGRHVERLEFLDVMLGDRPALTPAENFYQRMLAGDADEAQAQAESLLEDRPLSSYYDEVALKGLRLAANDAQRGVLSEAKLQQIRDTTALLVQSLADQEDRDPPPAEERSAVEEQSVAEKALPRRAAPAVPLPPPESWPDAWRGEGAVLCLPGRGPLDEAASAMLVQILGRHGLGARLLPHEAVSRTAIGRQDFSGVAMICLSYLDISGSPAHLRYLLRRLRQKAPGAPVVVGLWDANDEVLRDAALRGAIGAEHYTTSLAETVTACLETVRAVSTAPEMAPAAE